MRAFHPYNEKVHKDKDRKDEGRGRYIRKERDGRNEYKDERRKRSHFSNDYRQSRENSYSNNCRSNQDDYDNRYADTNSYRRNEKISRRGDEFSQREQDYRHRQYNKSSNHYKNNVTLEKDHNQCQNSGNREKPIDLLSGDGSSSNVTKTSTKKPDSQSNVDDNDAEMASLMGFSTFGTTRSQSVTGNNIGGVYKAPKPVQFRQYMNRIGGFNRLLES